MMRHASESSRKNRRRPAAVVASIHRCPDDSLLMNRARTGRVAIGLLAAAVLALSGCSAMSYNAIELGQGPREYDRILPDDTSRTTALGLCHLSKQLNGQTNAIVVFLTPDRRVAGKLYAKHIDRNWGFVRRSGYTLVGELDLEAYDVGQTGAIDTLRAMTSELTQVRGEPIVMDAHAWVAAGLVRLLQRWPAVEDFGVPSERLSELLELVPGGGAARISVTEDGVFLVEYRQGVQR